jgi:hypothetical protein
MSSSGPGSNNSAARADQTGAVRARLVQQNGQIVVLLGRLDAAGFDIGAQPFAELQFAHCRITPGPYRVMYHPGDFQRAHSLVGRPGGNHQQLAHQRVARGCRQGGGDGNEQVEIAAGFQATDNGRAEQMHGQQVPAQVTLQQRQCLLQLAGHGWVHERF